MACKGICLKYKTKKPQVNTDGRYITGQKRCSTCELYMLWDGIWCPCCHAILRNKPRNTKNRKQLQYQKAIKRI